MRTTHAKTLSPAATFELGRLTSEQIIPHFCRTDDPRRSPVEIKSGTCINVITGHGRTIGATIVTMDCYGSIGIAYDTDALWPIPLREIRSLRFTFATTTPADSASEKSLAKLEALFDDYTY